ncbi:MAG: rhomboid family intramembrane serine protease [Nanoarchaeota archaeon]|nr:rhomboid family intramembrane serine protease [Nanoarchaeota archaeon]
MSKIKFYSLWLCLICIIIFILQLLMPGFTELFVLNQLAYTEIWRFVSSIFLHGSLSHLLYNLFALALFGFILEKLIGSNKFLLVFFFSGIIANIISINFYASSLGASGAIMGILGCLAVIRPMMMVWAFGFPMPMFIASILWVTGDVLGALGALGNTGIGNIAHLSGIAVGFLVGLFLREWKTAKRQLINMPESYMRIWENTNMR